MNVREIVNLVNKSTDEELLDIIKQDPAMYTKVLEKSAEKYAQKIERVISKYKSDTVYVGQFWTAKEDCMNNFYKNQKVEISRVDLEENTVVIDGVASTDIDTLLEHFVPYIGQ